MSVIAWHIVNTFAGAEWDCHHGLLKRGYESYLPAYLDGSRRGRWRQGVLRPLFPGYLFLGIADGQGIAVAETVPGFASFLRYADRRLIALKEEAMGDLMVQSQEAMRRSLGERAMRDRDYGPGDWVAVPYGPLQGHPVQIERIDRSGNVSAYLGSMRVDFPISALPAAENRAYSVRGCA